jgi:hypothetical protein
MVKRAKYITRTTRDGDFTRMVITKVGGPDYPLALGTSNPPFEQIKHLMSSRPYDLGEADTTKRGGKRGGKRGSKSRRGPEKGSR